MSPEAHINTLNLFFENGYTDIHILDDVDDSTRLSKLVKYRASETTVAIINEFEAWGYSPSGKTERVPSSHSEYREEQTTNLAWVSGYDWSDERFSDDIYQSFISQR